MLAKIFLLITVFFSVAFAEDVHPKLVNTFGDWHVYLHNDSTQKTCFIESSPVSSFGNYSKRGNPAVWVRYVSDSIDEVSLTPGYKYKTGTFAEVNVIKGKMDNKKLASFEAGLKSQSEKGVCHTGASNVLDVTLFDIIGDEQAWLRNIQMDKKMIESMKKGSYFVAVSRSVKDTCSTDFYSLSGFTAAYNKMKQICESSN